MKRVYHQNWGLMVLRKSLEDLGESFADPYKNSLVDFKVGIIDRDLVITIDIESNSTWSMKKKDELIQGCIELVPPIFGNEYSLIRFDIYMDQQYMECVEFDWIPDCKTKEREEEDGDEN